MIDREIIKRAIAEDLAGGEDITSVATVSESSQISADFVARKSGVIAGLEIAQGVLEEVGLSDIKLFRSEERL
jgi:nicotinate-nucleotide pyrophosphorylase (carboxylating)